MGIKTPPFKEYERWTTARFFSFLRSALRKAWMKWPPRNEVVNKARRATRKTNVRYTYEYQCKICNKYFPRKEVEVDHIIPTGTLKTFDDLGTFAKNMFVGTDKLRVVCKPCHHKVTHGE